MRLFYFTQCSVVFLISVARLPLFPHCFTDGSVCSAPVMYTASHISFHVRQALAQQWIGFVLCTSETLNLERVTVQGCLWSQLGWLFKLHSFSWDGSNAHTVFHLVSWEMYCGAGFKHDHAWTGCAWFVPLSCHQQRCLRRERFIASGATATVPRPVLQSSVGTLGLGVGREVKLSLVCWGCGFKMKR